jgi:hypothetical protein
MGQNVANNITSTINKEIEMKYKIKANICELEE